MFGKNKEPVLKLPVSRTIFTIAFFTCLLAIAWQAKDLYKIARIYSNMRTLKVTHFDVTHGHRSKTCSETLYFSFDLEGKKHEIHITDCWWYSSCQIKMNEPFEIAYDANNPATCIPLAYLHDTAIYKTIGCLLGLLFVFISWTFRPWKYEVVKIDK